MKRRIYSGIHSDHEEKAGQANLEKEAVIENLVDAFQIIQ